MTPVPLLAALFVVPGVALLNPIDLQLGDGYVAMDSAAGRGPAAVAGDRLSLEFELQDGLGRSLANSSLRGLPFTYELSGAFAEPLLESALDGLRSGAERTTWFTSDFLPDGLGSLAPPHTELTLKVKILTINGRK